MSRDDTDMVTVESTDSGKESADEADETEDQLGGSGAW